MNNRYNDEGILKNNAFDVIRYFAAFSVMFLHYTYYAITMSEQKIGFLRVIRRITEFFPGVVILFALSGFLISASFERCKTKKEFFMKRIFRLYPELWACTLVNLIIIILLSREKLDKSIILWLFTQIFGIANTPSCLKDFATGSVNGALWTIFTEVQLYIFLGIIYNWTKKIKRGGWYVLLTTAAVVNLICNYLAVNMGGSVAKIIERIFLPYLIWFLIGVFCYQNREWVIPIIKKYLWIFCLVFVLNQIFHICDYGYYEDIITGITLPLITIGLAYTLPAVRMKRDISYGLFLYHWIVLNVMVYFDIFNNIPWYLCGIIFIIITIMLARLSREMVGNKIKKFIFRV